MSSNNNTSENKGIFGQARDFIHSSVQTEKEREVIDEGKKSSVDRAFEKLSFESKSDETEEPKKGFLGGAVESTRKAIYNSTKTDDEKKLEEDAKKSVTEKASSEIDESLGLSKMAEKVDDTLHATFLPLEGKDYQKWKENKDAGKDVVEDAVEKAENKVDTAKEKAENAKEKAEDKASNAYNKAEDKASSLYDQAKETGVEAVEKLSDVADKVDDGLHAATLPIEGKDYDDWKARKEQRKAEESPEGDDDQKPKDFIDKATEKVGSLSGGKKETKEVSQ